MNDRSVNINDTSKYVEGIEDIRQSLYIILNTIKGSDPMRPNFGSSMFEYLDSPINVILTDLYLDIIDSIEKYEQRVKIKKVNLYINREIVNIVLELTYTQTGESSVETVNIENFALKKKVMKAYNESYNQSYE